MHKLPSLRLFLPCLSLPPPGPANPSSASLTLLLYPVCYNFFQIHFLNSAGRGISTPLARRQPVEETRAIQRKWNSDFNFQITLLATPMCKSMRRHDTRATRRVDSSSFFFFFFFYICLDNAQSVKLAEGIGASAADCSNRVCNRVTETRNGIVNNAGCKALILTLGTNAVDIRIIASETKCSEKFISKFISRVWQRRL